MARPLKISREALDRYFSENPQSSFHKSYADLRRTFNVTQQTVSKSLKRYGIARPVKINRQILEDYLLSHPGTSVSDVMHFFDVSYSMASRSIYFHGLEHLANIAKRPWPPINPEGLKSYVEGHPDATIREISTALNRPYSGLYRAIRRLKLPVKRSDIKGGRPRKKIVPPAVD